MKKSPLQVMAIDQAFDKTGIALYFPKPPAAVEIQYLLSTFICRLDPRFQGRDEEMSEMILQRLSAAGGGSLELPPEGRRRLPIGFGVVRKKGLYKGLCLHFTIPYPPSDEPEWRQARFIARRLVQVGAWFTRHAENAGGEARIAIEGMAVNGMRSSIAILPCLGILYGAIWEELESNRTTKGIAREMPISRWKKAFAGCARADKKQVKSVCLDLGFGRIESDDESDAAALAYTLAWDFENEISKKTGGRLRPTADVRKSQAARRRAKKAR